MLWTILLEPAQAQALRAYANPVEAGFSVERLEEALAFADQNRAAAVVALHRGNVLAAWGAVERPLMMHSVRKSLANSLYGIAVRRRQWSLDDTLLSLGVQDNPPLTEGELGARVRDLISSRSGVYHSAAYASSEQDEERPARGSHAPGSFFFYNNWDFNAVETIYEQVSDTDIYWAFHYEIAHRVGMQDFDPHAQLRVLEPGNSRMPAHTFRLSARDLARFGQLYLQEGRWGGRQIVPRAWVRESFRRHSEFGPGEGYGYLWWIYEAGSLGENYPTLNRGPVYMARGSGGQALFIIPEADMVVAHLADTDNGRRVSGRAIWQLVERLVAARETRGKRRPALTAVAAAPLTSNVPPAAAPTLITLPPSELERFAGDYEIAAGAPPVRVFLYEQRLFVNMPGEGEAELFATGPETFVVISSPGVTVVFEGEPGAPANRAVATIGDRRIVTTRRPPSP